MGYAWMIRTRWKRRGFEWNHMRGARVEFYYSMESPSRTANDSAVSQNNGVD